MYVLDDGIPPYNMETDYRERLQKLVAFLIAKGYTNLVEKAANPSASVLSEIAPSQAQPSAQGQTQAQVVAPSAPSTGMWQNPGALNPNQDADSAECEGLEDEALADCLDNSENALVAQEQQTDAAAETGEYDLIDSDDPMAAAVLPEAPPTGASAGATNFSREDYERALAVCRISTAEQTYIQNQDLYCRVIALKEYLRQRGYRVMNDAPTSNKDEGVSFADGIQDYNQPVDFATRLQATRSLFPKP
jgi:hypothetical protein